MIISSFRRTQEFFTNPLSYVFVIFALIGQIPVSSAITKEQILSHARFDLFPDESDYIDEVLNGHRIRDSEKFKRQEGCMCAKQFIDPHCGSDMNTYDNGCFFLCAQGRSPALSLRKWGKCDEQREHESENGIIPIPNSPNHNMEA